MSDRADCSNADHLFFGDQIIQIVKKEVLIKLCLRADCSNADHPIFGSNYQNSHTGEILLKLSLRADWSNADHLFLGTNSHVFLDQILIIFLDQIEIRTCLSGRIAAMLTDLGQSLNTMDSQPLARYR